MATFLTGILPEQKKEPSILEGKTYRVTIVAVAEDTTPAMWERTTKHGVSRRLVDKIFALILADEEPLKEEPENGENRGNDPGEGDPDPADPH